MRQLNIHVPPRCNILLNDVWTFWPKVISGNQAVTQNSDMFDRQTPDPDEPVTPDRASNCDGRIQDTHTHIYTLTGRQSAAFPMTDSSFHPPQACRYDIIRLIMEQLIMTY